jgi:hypothetical protein
MIGLAIGAVIGAGIGIASLASKSRAAKDAARRQQELAQMSFNTQQGYQQNSYLQQKAQAQSQLALQQNRLSESLQSDFDAFNLQAQNQALQNQAAQIGQADSAAAVSTRIAASGTRGNSGLESRAALQQSAFDTQMSLQGQQEDMTVQNMSRQYSNQFGDIGREMSSWEAGGYRYNANQLQLQYNEDMFRIQQMGYQTPDSPTALDYASAAFGGAASGAGFGGQIQNFKDQAGHNNAGTAGDNTGGTQPTSAPPATQGSASAPSNPLNGVNWPDLSQRAPAAAYQGPYSSGYYQQLPAVAYSGPYSSGYYQQQANQLSLLNGGWPSQQQAQLGGLK